MEDVSISFRETRLLMLPTHLCCTTILDLRQSHILVGKETWNYGEDGHQQQYARKVPSPILLRMTLLSFKYFTQVPFISAQVPKIQ